MWGDWLYSNNGCPPAEADSLKEIHAAVLTIA